jgi:hypothetical protein
VPSSSASVVRLLQSMAPSGRPTDSRRRIPRPGHDRLPPERPHDPIWSAARYANPRAALKRESPGFPGLS